MKRRNSHAACRDRQENRTFEQTDVSEVRWMARTAFVAIVSSIALMIVPGFQGPSAAVATFPSAAPWPPWFVGVHPSPLSVALMLWMAVLLGGSGLAFALAAVRRGWRPRPMRLMAGSTVAVVALMVIPPVASADMLLYAASGRITVLGHSPYVMTPGELMSSGDPVGSEAIFTYPHDPSRYGPAATAAEAAASELGGESLARTIFWLKVWDALAFLTIVFLLDRAVRSDTVRRVRVHLLWSVNPLMLWAAMAGGHNDVLAVAAGVSAILIMRQADSRRSLLAGVLLGLATAIKAPYALLGTGLLSASRKSPRTLGILALGAAMVLIPGYLLSGWPAVSATSGLTASSPVGQSPWTAVALVLQKELHGHNATASVNILALLGSVLLAAVLLWRMPPAWPEFTAVRASLVAVLALLIVSPQTQPWYAIMIFPLLALFPASRLDWIVVTFASTSAIGGVPFLLRVGSHPAWFLRVARYSEWMFLILSLVAEVLVLLWLCRRGNWRSAVDPMRVRGLV